MWWHIFVDKWNGISLMWDLNMTEFQIQVFSDASGSWGCGVVQDFHWLQLEWNSRLQHLSIAVKELIPVVLAAATFGHRWSGKLVKFMVDNAAVVDVLNSTFCKESHMMHLIHLLVFYAAKFNFWFSASHIPGKYNTLADALSRNNTSLFFSQVPQLDRQTSLVSPAPVDLLSQNITWTSTTWIKLFRDSIQQD